MESESVTTAPSQPAPSEPAAPEIEPTESIGASAQPDFVITGAAQRRDYFFDIPTECALARLELSIHIVGNATGPIAIVAPDGTQFRESLNVTTTSNFKRSWSWDHLDTFHNRVGQSMSGRFILQPRFRRASRYGGSVPNGEVHRSSDGPAAKVRRATMKLWCQKPARNVSGEFHAATEFELERVARYSKRAFFRISERCEIETLDVIVGVTRRTITGSFDLVTPSGASLRLGHRIARDRTLLAHFGEEIAGQSSDGVWELREGVGEWPSGAHRIKLAVTCKPLLE